MDNFSLDDFSFDELLLDGFQSLEALPLSDSRDDPLYSSSGTAYQDDAWNLGHFNGYSVASSSVEANAPSIFTDQAQRSVEPPRDSTFDPGEEWPSHELEFLEYFSYGQPSTEGHAPALELTGKPNPRYEANGKGSSILKAVKPKKGSDLSQFPGYRCFSLGTHRQLRAEYSAKRGLEIREIRQLGACLRCRILKKPVSH